MGVCSVYQTGTTLFWVNYATVSLGIEKLLTKYSWNLWKHHESKPSHFHWGCLEQTGSIIPAASGETNILSALK